MDDPTALLLRPARDADVVPLLALINSYADRNLLLRRSEESLRARLADFSVAERGGEVVGCGALSELGPGIGEVRSLAVRSDQTGLGVGHELVEHLLYQAGERRFAQVLALTRRVSFFAALGFEVTDRRRFEDKLRTDCRSCPLNVCCDETAMVRPPLVAAMERPQREARSDGIGGYGSAALGSSAPPPAT
jgi:amino-acid N-acetyltransferase